MSSQNGFGGHVYVVLSGKLKMTYRRPEGNEMVLTILGPWEIFGAVALFDSESREITATALTEVAAVPIERDQILRWIAEYPEFGDQMLRLFARWVKASTNCWLEFASADARSRVANQLLLLRKRFGRRDGEAVRVVHDLTLKDFSRFVGIAPKAIVAILRDFQDCGWIRLEDNSVVVVDAHALASLPHTSSPEAHCV